MGEQTSESSTQPYYCSVITLKWYHDNTFHEKTEYKVIPEDQDISKDFEEVEVEKIIIDKRGRKTERSSAQITQLLLIGRRKFWVIIKRFINDSGEERVLFRFVDSEGPFKSRDEAIRYAVDSLETPRWTEA